MEANNADYGLLCFSRGFKSPLLWGHYADSAKGVALGFEADLLPWKDPITVRYDHHRPHLDWAADDQIDREFTDKMLCCCFGVKAKEWEYEEEVRHILVLGQCAKDGDMFFAPYPPAALRQIILGYRCTATPDDIREMCRQASPGQDIEIRLSNPHPVDFAVELAPPDASVLAADC